MTPLEIDGEPIADVKARLTAGWVRKRCRDGYFIFRHDPLRAAREMEHIFGGRYEARAATRRSNA